MRKFLALILLSMLFAVTACANPGETPAPESSEAASPAAASPEVSSEETPGPAGSEEASPAASPEAEASPAYRHHRRKPPSSSDLPPPPPSSASKFPWPPPPPSSALEITADHFHDAKYLGDVNAKLKAALSEAGYVDGGRYYPIPHGFVIATQVEHINRDGSPLAGEERWQPKPLPPDFTLANILKVLFDAKPGFYRIIVFAVTDEPIAPEGKPPTQEEASVWLHQGMLSLPSTIAQIPYTKATACTALIYEFERRGYNDATHPLTPGASAMAQLVGAKIWSALGH
jgi:hypothetical protein